MPQKGHRGSLVPSRLTSPLFAALAVQFTLIHVSAPFRRDAVDGSNALSARSEPESALGGFEWVHHPETSVMLAPSNSRRTAGLLVSAESGSRRT